MKRIVVLVALSLVFNSCSQFKSISDALAALKRLQFKLGNVASFKLAGIDISNKSSLSDFDALGDGLRLLDAYRTKTLPATFTLNVEVKNPNDGSQGNRSMAATLKSLDFRLLVDDKPTISGDIGRAFSIPASGTITTVPVEVSMDVLKFFGDKSYNDIINLAMALGGRSGSAARLTLDAKPTVETSIGDLTYPGRINIIDKEYRN